MDIKDVIRELADMEKAGHASKDDECDDRRGTGTPMKSENVEDTFTELDFAVVPMTKQEVFFLLCQ